MKRYFCCSNCGKEYLHPLQNLCECIRNGASFYELDPKFLEINADPFWRNVWNGEQTTGNVMDALKKAYEQSRRNFGDYEDLTRQLLEAEKEAKEIK